MANPQTWQESLLPFFITGLLFVVFFATGFLAVAVFLAVALGAAAFLTGVFFAATFLTALFFGLAIILFSPFHPARSQRLMHTVYQNLLYIWSGMRDIKTTITLNKFIIFQQPELRSCL